MQKYGIMGGTFDPIHLGHLVVAEAARHAFGLDKICFIPTGRPPHKESVGQGEHRFNMVLLATADHPHFFVSRLELDRPGYSYSLDTVERFKECYDPAEVYFLSGADVLPNLHNWHRYKELLKACHFVVVSRPGFSFEGSAHLTATELASIEFLTVPALDISSSDIRRRVAASEPINYLVPGSVESYIQKEGLYTHGN